MSKEPSNLSLAAADSVLFGDSKITQPPVNEPSFDNVYILYYRGGSDPHTKIKHFRFNGTFPDAIHRGRRYCENVNLRFIKVEKFFTDLIEEERLHQVG